MRWSKHRDTPELIVERIKERLSTNGLIHSVGKDVLGEHPLVGWIDQMDDDYIGFKMKSGREFRVSYRGVSEEVDPEFNGYGEKWMPFPPPEPKAIAKPSRPDFDDEIPF